MARKPYSSGLTIADLLESLAPGLVKRGKPLPSWPPDTFALTASVLQRSGAYTLVVQKKLGNNWVAEITAVAQQWRHHFTTSVPSEVDRWWRTVMDGGT